MRISKRPSCRSGCIGRLIAFAHRRWILVDRIDDLRVRNRSLQDQNADLRAQIEAQREMLDWLRYENQIRGMLAKKDLQATATSQPA